MPLRSISLRLPLLAGCLLALAPAARAQSGVSVSVQSTSTEIYAYNSGPGTITDSHADQMSDPVFAMKSTGSRAMSNTIIANSNGSASGSAQIGQAQVSIVSNEYGGGGSNNQAVAQWSDMLLITSSTLPPGTPAQIRLFAQYRGSFSSFLSRSGFPMDFYSGSMEADIASSASLNGGSPVDFNYSGASHIPVLAGDPELPMNVTLTQNINVQVGQTLFLTSSAQLTEIVSGGFKETVLESGSLTTTFAATSLTSAVTLTQVPAATPEPGAIALLGSGLLTGFCLLRRRKA